MQDILPLLIWPFAASIVLIGIHAYFGLHVLRRGIVFADLALAQISALGATLAFAAGHAVGSPESFLYALACTVAGAALLTASRRVAPLINQEAFIGVMYVAATAATILVIDRSPQGAEHVKRILIGSILSVDEGQVMELAVLYALVGAVLWALHGRLVELSEHLTGGARPAWHVIALDLAFYVAFGIVVTSSVAVAGILLVFCFLIIPALIGAMFTRRIGRALAIGWATGIAASTAGLFGSFAFDAPTGAAMVLALVGALVIGTALRALVFTTPAERARRTALALRVVGIAGAIIVLASSLWLIVAPAADQPLLAAFEAAFRLGPEPFLSEDERATYEDAAATAQRLRAQIEGLNARERAARWQGAGLSDEDVRNIGSYQRSFNEMARGELFVMDVLKGRARERQRWYVGLPLAAAATAGLAMPFLMRRGRASAGFRNSDAP
jgi:zinc/manganese transport system permease protein